MHQRLLLLSASLLVVADCATFGSMGSRPLAENQTHADHLLVDLSHAYVTSADGPSTRIVRVSKEREGPPVVLATVPGKVADTALDGDFVYWVVDHPDAAEPVDTIQKAPKGAVGPITTVELVAVVLNVAAPVTTVAVSLLTKPVNVAVNVGSATP